MSSADEEVQALRRISGRSYYDSEQFRKDEQYFSEPHPSEHFTLKDFWFYLSHTYHNPAYPPPGAFRIFSAACWVFLIIEGVRWLCS